MIGKGWIARAPVKILRTAVGAAFLASLSFAQAPGNLPRHAILGASVVDQSGVRIASVRPGSAAARGQLHVDDLILSVGGSADQTASEFAALIKRLPTGKPIVFRIRRGGSSLALLIVLDAAANESDPLVETLYQSIEVDGTLRRTLLTFPKNVQGRRPAVLVLGGIGCFTVDSAADPQDSYMRLAHDLGRRGFVAMRLEKSGVGDSQGPPCMTVDLVAEMHSYVVALNALERDSHVDQERVYLFGHSIGTLIAPRIANGEKITGVIIAEAVGRNWIEYELWNLRRQLELAGESPAEVDATLAMKEICMHRLLIEKEDESEIERTQPQCKVHNAYPAPPAYLQEVAAMNIVDPWMKFSLPVLAIYGSADFVTVEADHRRIVDIVNSSLPGAATLKTINGMDHHLDVAGTQQQAYNLRVRHHSSGPYDEELSVAVLDWLCQREHCLPIANSPQAASELRR